jgi:hypothetical protein
MAAVVPLIAALASTTANAAPCLGVCGPSAGNTNEGFHGDSAPEPVTGREYVVSVPLTVTSPGIVATDQGWAGFAYCDRYPNNNQPTSGDSLIGGGAHFEIDPARDGRILAQHPVGFPGVDDDTPPFGWSAHFRFGFFNQNNADTVRIYALCRDDSWPRHNF